jgi:hypothetical protein
MFYLPCRLTSITNGPMQLGIENFMKLNYKHSSNFEWNIIHESTINKYGDTALIWGYLRRIEPDKRKETNNENKSL